MLPLFNFKTEKGNLILKCLDVVEPNNGRMLYKVGLYLENLDITKEYFGNWNYINYYLDKYSATSNDEKWIYIPNEGSHFLIRTDDLQKISLPYIPAFAAIFIENIFFDEFLIILSTEFAIIKNLQNGLTKKIETLSEKVIFVNFYILNGKFIFGMNDNNSLEFCIGDFK